MAVAWSTLPNTLQDSLAGKRVKIFKAELVNIKHNKAPGEIFSKDDMVLFATKDPKISLRVISFQLEGKTKTNEKEFLIELREFLSNAQVHNKPNSV